MYNVDIFIQFITMNKLHSEENYGSILQLCLGTLRWLIQKQTASYEPHKVSNTFILKIVILILNIINID